MTPEMIRQLPARYALVIRGGMSPVIARLPMAWNDPAYKRARRNGTPPPSWPRSPSQPRSAPTSATADAEPWPGWDPDLDTPPADGTWDDPTRYPVAVRRTRQPWTRPDTRPWDALTAVLLQITQHAERLAVLDEREATHHQQIAGRLTELARAARRHDRRPARRGPGHRRPAGSRPRLPRRPRPAGRHPRRPAHRPRHRPTPTATADDGDSYQPAPTATVVEAHRRRTRGQALARLRAWVEQIYRPGYGHLAAALGPCWDQHPLCLYGLDWLMELWSRPLPRPRTRHRRTVASQAEWQTRLLPALAEQMYLETTRCQHRQPGHPRPQQGPAAQRSGDGWRSGHERPGDH